MSCPTSAYPKVKSNEYRSLLSRSAWLLRRSHKPKLSLMSTTHIDRKIDRTPTRKCSPNPCGAHLDDCNQNKWIARYIWMQIRSVPNILNKEPQSLMTLNSKSFVWLHLNKEHQSLMALNSKNIMWLCPMMTNSWISFQLGSVQIRGGGG